MENSPINLNANTAIDPNRLYTRLEVSELFRVKKTTLEKWATIPFGPTFTKMGRLTRYMGSDLLAFIEKQKVSFGEVSHG